MLNKPKNDNYAAVVVEIKTLVPLAGCDFVQAAIIMGNQVIVDRSTKEGDIGLYFPLETQLTESFLKANNLYRKPELNADNTKKGYFEENGRIRCVKFRGHKSEGLFMPIGCLAYIFPDTFNPSKTGLWYPKEVNINIGDTFDELNGIEICRKYVIKKSKTPGLPGSGKGNKRAKKYESKLIENQFRFHEDTLCVDFYRNVESFIG